jgi:hypothetical protein
MDKWLKQAAYGAIAIFVISVAIFVLTQHSTNNTTIDQIKTAEQQACIGTNVNRAVTNESNLLTFNGLKDSIHYTQSQKNALVKILSSLGISKNFSVKAGKESDRQLKNQRARYRELFWTQLADCSDPGLHTNPVVIYSFKQKVPPHSQLSIRNANVITPLGS